MIQQAHRYSRAQFAQVIEEANQRARVPDGAVTIAWRRGGTTRTASLSYLVSGLLILATTALGAWGVAVTSYLAFRDDILGSLMTRQAEVQHGYEDRIRDLRQEIERLTSRHLVEQTDIERRMEQMARRQATLESRQTVIASLGAGAQSRSTASRSLPSLPGVAPAVTGPVEPRPQPVGDTVRIGAPVQRQSQLESRPFTVATAPQAGGFTLASLPAPGDRLAHLARSLDTIERRQADILQSLELTVDRRARKIRSVLAELGIDHRRARPAPAGETAGTGGPLIPLPQAAGPGASPFERQVFRLQSVIRDEEELMRIVDAVPFGRPHAGDLELSSGFGARLDPFLRTWALHSGVDFRGATGEPVFATAYGRVVHAGAMGGYGLLVEIDHGNGLTTRYAHLSRILVKEGDMIRTGQRIGRVGSTGRSTGPHLHYETRVNGEAVDPMRYLRAGVRLAGAL